MNRISLTPQKRIFIGITLISVLFVISLFLPFSEHRHLNQFEEWQKTTYTLLYQTPLVWLFVANFAMILFAALSGNRILLIVFTILVAILSSALYVLCNIIFTSGGRPIPATFGNGYYLSQLTILVLFFFSFRWERLFKQMQLSKNHVRIFTLLTLAVPVLLGTAIFLTIRHNINLPIKRSEFVYNSGSKSIKSESWDYTEKYNIYVQKYFSKDSSANEGIPFQIDSITVQFVGSNRVIRKKIENTTFDLDTYLEKMCD